LLVGIETADDATVYQLSDEQALIIHRLFSYFIVHWPYDFIRTAATAFMATCVCDGRHAM
jgi:selenide,water dikinase